MIEDIAKALAQVFDGRFLGVLVKSLILTVALLAALIVGAIYLMGFIPDLNFTIPWIGYDVAFLDEVAGAASLGLVLVLSAFLMFPVAAVFIGLFLDEIADAVEARHYPHLPEPRRQGVAEAVVQGVKFAVVLVLANLAALIIYLLSTVLAPFIFWIVNGYLLGREYAEIVAMRRMDVKEAKAFRRRHLVSIWIAGALMAIPLSIPIVNLIAPLVGVAVFVHLFHRKRRTAAP